MCCGCACTTGAARGCTATTCGCAPADNPVATAEAAADGKAANCSQGGITCADTTPGTVAGAAGAAGDAGAARAAGTAGAETAAAAGGVAPRGWAPKATASGRAKLAASAGVEFGATMIFGAGVGGGARIGFVIMVSLLETFIKPPPAPKFSTALGWSTMPDSKTLPGRGVVVFAAMPVPRCCRSLPTPCTIGPNDEAFSLPAPPASGANVVDSASSLSGKGVEPVAPSAE
mmetsp:Transcript_113838/g.361838  ORF Transcript_113838/g.361838 Transcript_113838/m.361838 type:complete len:231 (-) Transcript_113838:577-1269(-)